MDAKIFLLDMDDSSGTGAELRDILESSPNLKIRYQGNFTGPSANALSENEYPYPDGFDDDITFLVLPQARSGEFDAIVRKINRHPSKMPLIIVTGAGRPDEMFRLLKLGASDFITPPLRQVDILPRLWRLLGQRRKDDGLLRTLKEKIGLRQIIGNSPSFLVEMEKIPAVARCDVNVLISGETGTGKELFARAIHYLSQRADKPFIPVNCGAIPDELIENELFGHIQGAYTGAGSTHPGLIREAEGGTIFLDEIDCLPHSSQVKFLRFLQEKEYKQLGSAKICRADVRVIAATNIDLENATKNSRFRQDLFYRLNIIQFVLPPLRTRKDDIPLLASHFLEKYSIKFNKHINAFSSEAIRKLLLYEWPGNVRELENILERAIVLSHHTEIQDSDVILPQSEAGGQHMSFKEAKEKTIEQFERDYISRLLFANGGNITRAAKAAEKNRRAFWELIRKHKINVENYAQ